MWEFSDFAHFCEFWKDFGTREEVYLHEAAEVFFDRENEVEVNEQLDLLGINY